MIVQEPTVKTINTYELLKATLTAWGVTCYTGVTGGGVIHFLKYLDPLQGTEATSPSFFTIGEYVAGFIPLGYYLASGKIAAAVATTGAATKLLACGLSDAKLHNIPAIYIVPITSMDSLGLSPLQDTSVHGSNMIEQLKAELPESVFILDQPSTITEKLALAKIQLEASKPVVLVLDNAAYSNDLIHIASLTKKIAINEQIAYSKAPDFVEFIENLRKATHNRRLTILVGEEMARYEGAPQLTSKLSTLLKAATIWSMNGANAISPANPYGYGYISFGGNGKAVELYRSLGEDDVLLILGACPDEYTTNLSRFTAAHSFFVNSIAFAYGLVCNSLSHLADNAYHQLQMPLDQFVEVLIEEAQEFPFSNVHAPLAPENLNKRSFSKARDGYVDMAHLYLRLHQWWPQQAIVLDDVCLAYKDRQYVTQRPSTNARAFSLYRGSAMGGAFGAAVGAKLAMPESLVALFTGDGCFRLFAGALGEVAHLGLVIFLLNNETLAIVEQGLYKILPETPIANYHATVSRINYCEMAKACGWDAAILQPDLANLDALLYSMTQAKSRSFLIEVPVDPLQILGNNPRVNNL